MRALSSLTLADEGVVPVCQVMKSRCIIFVLQHDRPFWQLSQWQAIQAAEHGRPFWQLSMVGHSGN